MRFLVWTASITSSPVSEPITSMPHPESISFLPPRAHRDWHGLGDCAAGGGGGHDWLHR
jgi:hypothetical protein